MPSYLYPPYPWKEGIITHYYSYFKVRKYRFREGKEFA